MCRLGWIIAGMNRRGLAGKARPKLPLHPMQVRAVRRRGRDRRRQAALLRRHRSRRTDRLRQELRDKISRRLLIPRALTRLRIRMPGKQRRAHRVVRGKRLQVSQRQAKARAGKLRRLRQRRRLGRLVKRRLVKHRKKATIGQHCGAASRRRLRRRMKT